MSEATTPDEMAKLLGVPKRKLAERARALLAETDAKLGRAVERTTAQLTGRALEKEFVGKPPHRTLAHDHALGAAPKPRR
jgi:hypothetical protein